MLLFLTHLLFCCFVILQTCRLTVPPLKIAVLIKLYMNNWLLISIRLYQQGSNNDFTIKDFLELIPLWNHRLKASTLYNAGNATSFYHLRVGSPTSLARHLLPETTSRFWRQFLSLFLIFGCVSHSSGPLRLMCMQLSVNPQSSTYSLPLFPHIILSLSQSPPNAFSPPFSPRPPACHCLPFARFRSRLELPASLSNSFFLCPCTLSPCCTIAGFAFILMTYYLLFAAPTLSKLPCM